MNQYISRRWAELERVEGQVRSYVAAREHEPYSLRDLITELVKDVTIKSTESTIRGAIWDLIERRQLQLTWDRKLKLLQQ